VGSIEAVKGEEPVFFESLTTAAAILGRFRRIGVAIGGMVLPLHDPRLLAKQVGSLHVLTGGRLTIGPGVGSIQKSFEVMQTPYERRGQLFDEYLGVLHALCYAHSPVSYHGEMIHFDNATFYPRANGLRLLIAGENQRTLRRAAKFGHGWLTSYPELGAYATKVCRLRELASSSGRDPDAIDTAVIVFVCLGSTRERALEMSGPTLARRLGSLERAEEVSIIGTPEEATQRILEMHKAGARYLHLRPVTRDAGAWIEMTQQISEDVLPAVRLS
jgi:alkanesulfonate monooxygenase SsuD/methylene tetrahydromethanopterin reductase-like flavin-dependent oxidoreductase (luciferase family)